MEKFNFEISYLKKVCDAITGKSFIKKIDGKVVKEMVGKKYKKELEVALRINQEKIIGGYNRNVNASRLMGEINAHIKNNREYFPLNRWWICLLYLAYLNTREDVIDEVHIDQAEVLRIKLYNLLPPDQLSPYQSGSWRVFFQDFSQDENNNNLYLLEGILTFKPIRECEFTFEYKEDNIKKTEKRKGIVKIWKENNNILTLLFGLHENYDLSQLPYLHAHLIIDPIKRPGFIEGVYTKPQTDNTIITGLWLMKEIKDKEIKKERMIDLYDEKYRIFKDSKLDTVIRNYFVQSYKKKLVVGGYVSPKLNEIELRSRERKINDIPQDYDIFISTPIRFLESELRECLKKIVVKLIDLFVYVLGFKKDKIKCSLAFIDNPSREIRISNKSTLDDGIFLLRRSKNYLFFSPIQNGMGLQKNDNVSSSYLELGWAMFNYESLRIGILSSKELPKYLESIPNTFRFQKSIPKFEKPFENYFSSEVIYNTLFNLCQHYAGSNPIEEANFKAAYNEIMSTNF